MTTTTKKTTALLAALALAVAHLGAVRAETTLGRALSIYKGEETTSENFPFGAIICSTLYSEDSCDAICTGSLVAPGVVLTAAHCFNDFMPLYAINNDFSQRKQYERRVTSSYRVVFGVDHSGPHRNEDAVGVKKIVVGEPFDYSEGSASWDVALVFLEDCKDDVDPVKLLRADEYSSESELASLPLPPEVQIFGWGDSESFCVTPYDVSDHHDPMQVMTYQIQNCQKMDWCVRNDNHCDTSNSFCMTTDNVATCSGDSGGPIFVRAPLDRGPLRIQAFDGEAASDQAAAQEEEEEEEEEGEEVEVFVQVGILSGGEVISTKYAAGTLGHFRGYLDNPDEAFRDEAQAALLPAYTEWLRKHLETDACLLESHLSVDDLFLDISQVQSEKLD